MPSGTEDPVLRLPRHSHLHWVLRLLSAALRVTFGALSRSIVASQVSCLGPVLLILTVPTVMR